jgi:hypothetical protein
VGEPDLDGSWLAAVQWPEVLRGSGLAARALGVIPVTTPGRSRVPPKACLKRRTRAGRQPARLVGPGVATGPAETALSPSLARLFLRENPHQMHEKMARSSSPRETQGPLDPLPCLVIRLVPEGQRQLLVCPGRVPAQVV